MKKPVFHTDAYVTECTASITEILEIDGQYHLQLDKEIFYPEGGGQPCDLGTIDSVPILAVYEQDGSTWHITDVLPHTNRPVLCRIDWIRRFDHMQQHSGQHLLSAVMDRMFDNGTVGFRLTDDYVTIDLENKLDEAQVREAEKEANRLVWANRPIKAYWPSREKLEALPLRKQPKVEEAIRVVEVDSYDFSPCCGTHVRSTSEIGLIKISRIENHKSGIRLEFRCGRRAWTHYQQLVEITGTIGKALSVPTEDIVSGFEKLRSEKEMLKEELACSKEALLIAKASQMHDHAPVVSGVRVVRLLSDTPVREMKELASLMARNPKTAVIMGTNADDKAQILLQRSTDLESVNMKSIFATVIGIIDGKGGGNPAAAQGGGPNADALERCLDEALAAVEHSLKQSYPTEGMPL